MKHHSPASSSARPLDALLAAYAAGSLPLPLHALVGSHVELNPRSASFVSDLDVIGGAEIARQEPVAVTTRDAMLARIFSLGDSPAAMAPQDPIFPPSMLRFVGRGSRDMAWRMVLPGVKECVIPCDDEIEAKLYWIKAGRKMPAHTHEGEEITIVLKGGFTDISGHYGRGDVAIADDELDHTPVADSDEDCICFAVTDAPLKLTGPVGRLVQSLFRN